MTEHEQREPAEAAARLAVRTTLSVCYALSAYAAANLFNTMWIDAVALFPLLVLCHEKMLEKERDSIGRWTVFYILCTAGSLYLNYYIAYMALLFIAVRTLLISGGLRGMFKCLWATVLGAGLVMALLLPAALSIAGSAKDFSFMPDPVRGLTLSPPELLGQFRPGIYEVRDIFFGLPNLYCGTAAAVCCLLYFLFTKEKTAGKWKDLTLLLLLAVSFCSNSLNRIWHAGMLPAGYPYRNSFLFVFLVLSAASVFLESLIRRAGALSSSRKRIPAAACVLLLCILQLAEVGYNTNHIVGVLESTNTPSADAYARDVRAREEIRDAVRASYPGFYRAETTVPFSENDSLQYGYAGIRHYSSVQQTDIRRFLTDLGFNDTGLYTDYSGMNTHTADALLGLKFRVYEDHIDRYDHTLPMAFTVSEKTAAAERETAERAAAQDMTAETPAQDPFTLTEQLLLLCTDQEALQAAGHEAGSLFIRPGTTDAGDGVFLLEPAVSGDLYLYITGTENDPQDIQIYADGEWKGEFGNSACREVTDLGYYEKGETVRVELTGFSHPWPSEAIFFASEDTKAVDACIETAEERAAAVTEVTSSKFRVTAAADKDPAGSVSGLVLLFPYSRDWHASVNGRKVQPERYIREYMRIPLPEEALRSGNAEVELFYVPRGLYAGIFGSAVSALLFVFLAVRRCGRRTAPCKMKNR